MNPALLTLRLSALQGLVRPNFTYEEPEESPHEDNGENGDVDVDVE